MKSVYQPDGTQKLYYEESADREEVFNRIIARQGLKTTLGFWGSIEYRLNLFQRISVYLYRKHHDPCATSSLFLTWCKVERFLKRLIK